MKEVDQNSKFCPNCGKKILEVSSSNINQGEPSTEPEVVNSFNQEGINSVEEKLMFGLQYFHILYQSQVL